MKNALEIILQEETQKIFDNFAESFGVVILFYSINGKELKRGLDKAGSMFCQIVQEHLYGKKKCIFTDEKRCVECARKKRPVAYKCHAGIDEAVAPVFISGQLAGYAMIGQFRSSEELPAKTLKDAKAKGVDKELKKAFYALPFYEKKKRESILGLFSLIADYMAAREIVSVRGERIIAKALGYIEENIHRRITLSETAKAVGRSCSTLSHAFTKFTGKPFSQTVIEAKLTRAEEYFKNSPELSIEETAFNLGYEDALYFSRLYKKYRGVPPSEYRNRFRN
jgi:AraC-like DNA-binding protein/ligand-binding sensor protein